MNAYPGWLLIWNSAFLIVCPVVLIAAHRKTAPQARNIPSEDLFDLHPEGLTACLWIFLPLMSLPRDARDPGLCSDFRLGVPIMRRITFFW